MGFAGHDLLLLLLDLIESVLKFDLLLVHFNELVRLDFLFRLDLLLDCSDRGRDRETVNAAILANGDQLLFAFSTVICVEQLRDVEVGVFAV